jgi:hypothetical protein
MKNNEALDLDFPDFIQRNIAKIYSSDKLIQRRIILLLSNLLDPLKHMS